MTHPRVYADFQNRDAKGRLRLNCVGTCEDLARLGIDLRAGLELTLYADDRSEHGGPDELLIDGSVSFSDDEQCWVANVDWSTICHASEIHISASAAPAHSSNIGAAP